MAFDFNLKKARIYQALRWAVIFRFDRFFQKLFSILFILTFLLFLYGFLTESFFQTANPSLLGAAIIFLSLAVCLRLKIAFFNQKLKNPAIKNENNLAEFLSLKAAKAVQRGRLDDPGLNFIYYRLLLDAKEIKKIKIDFTPEIILEAKNSAQRKGNLRISTGDLLIALAKQNPVFQKLLIDFQLKVEDIENLTWWLESLEKRIQERKKWWKYENLVKRNTLAKEWTAGYTLTLDKFSTDWTEIAKKQGFPEIIGHQKEIEQAEIILARQEYNNVLLVGEPGVGRRAIIQGLVQKSVLGQSLPDVNYKRVVELNIPSLLAEISNPEEVETILDRIFQEAISAGNVILVIDEFHNFIGVKPGPGIIDISGVISAYLHLPQFQIVAITTFSGLHKNLEQNPSILNLFAKVEALEISERETLMILENLTLALEYKYKLFVIYPTLREIVTLTGRFLPSLPFPKKAIDLLDEAIIFVKKSTKDKIVLPKHAAKIISDKTQIPVGEMEAKEKAILLDLENLIHQRIINQEEAVKEVSTALRRARAEVSVRKGPMGTFLFLGPTGVGKTETSKALAAIYFSSESKMITLDMSEFQDIKDIPRLIGSPGEEGLLTTPVIENPFSLILLDEIEKAHPNILNLFLQVLDEGRLTDGLGRKVDFKNSIIIATSNAGYQIILQALKENSQWSQVKQKLLDYIFEQGIFRPEFINRFDAVVVFTPLSKENLLAIAQLMLQKIKKNLQEKGIEFLTALPLEEKIVELSYNPTFGARAMKRVIQDKVENVLAAAILSGELKRGDKVKMDDVNSILKIE